MKIENFEGFFRKYEKFSVKIAYRALRNKENAEDVCQDVFIHFYKILDYLDLSNEKMLESLIYTATMNKCRDFIKKSRKGHLFFLPGISPSMRSPVPAGTDTAMKVRKIR